MAEWTGIAYDNVRWQDLEGQPFGIGVGYNGLIFGNLENMVDVEGPVAIQRNASSYRGMSIGFGRMGKQTIPYSAKDVRFLAGGNTSIAGALTVVGNTLTAGNGFQVGSGSTYLIGKDGSANQRQTLAQLYAANGSPYWEPADRGLSYVISSYDVPRRIPAARVNANVPAFFSDARASLDKWQSAFAGMTANGKTAPGEYGYIFTGTDASQNVFDLTWPAGGSVTGNLAFNVPTGSVNIVRIYSGDEMSVSTPLWGREGLESKTLFVLMNAKSVRLSFPSVIYGSVFAPNTVWNAYTTGGSIKGNAALAGLWVQQGSGFELHWYPFGGGVGLVGGSVETPAEPESPACPACPVCPAPAVCPECPPATVCPECPPVPECPACPVCPVCPEPTVCPECPVCPPATVCPACPVCPEPTVCPECPVCPPATVCPVCPECPACPVCPECPVTSGVIAGCVIPSGQCLWRVKLCDAATRQVLSIWQNCGMDCFSFEANPSGTYALEVETCCHYELCLKNVGVRSLSVRR